MEINPSQNDALLAQIYLLILSWPKPGENNAESAAENLPGSPTTDSAVGAAVNLTDAFQS